MLLVGHYGRPHDGSGAHRIMGASLAPQSAELPTGLYRSHQPALSCSPLSVPIPSYLSLHCYASLIVVTLWVPMAKPEPATRCLPARMTAWQPDACKRTPYDHQAAASANMLVVPGRPA